MAWGAARICVLGCGQHGLGPFSRGLVGTSRGSALLCQGAAAPSLVVSQLRPPARSSPTQRARSESTARSTVGAGCSTTALPQTRCAAVSLRMCRHVKRDSVFVWSYGESMDCMDAVWRKPGWRLECTGRQRIEPKPCVRHVCSSSSSSSSSLALRYRRICETATVFDLLLFPEPSE